MAKFTESDVIDIGSRTIDFLNRLSSDDALKARIKGLDKFDMEGLHGILGDEGISMTKDELGIAAGLIVKAMTPQAGAELREDELETVAGGKGGDLFSGLGPAAGPAEEFTGGVVDGLNDIFVEGPTNAYNDTVNGVNNAVNTVSDAFSGW